MEWIWSDERRKRSQQKACHYITTEVKKRKEKRERRSGEEIALGHFSNIYQDSNIWFTVSPKVFPTSNKTSSSCLGKALTDKASQNRSHSCLMRGNSTGMLKDGKSMSAVNSCTDMLTDRERGQTNREHHAKMTTATDEMTQTQMERVQRGTHHSDYSYNVKYSKY